MDFSFTSEQEALRERVRDFLKQELPAGYEGQWDECPQGEEEWKLAWKFTKKLAEKNLYVGAWPKEYGGGGLTPFDQLVVEEELLSARAPLLPPPARGIVGPSLILFGSENQKNKILPRIAKGEIFFCVAYSEPNAGSDLASLKTRAVQDGSDFIINGQKIWCSYAHKAQYCWLLARTNLDAAKHKGLSLFVVDMQTPGITVVPIIGLDGHHHTNELFLDDVRVPAENLVGQKDNGWFHLMSALNYERAPTYMSNAPARGALNDIIRFVKKAKGNGIVLPNYISLRHRIAEIAIELEVALLLSYRVTWQMSKGEVPSFEASMSKIRYSEMRQKVANLGMQALGLYGILKRNSKYAYLYGKMVELFLGSVVHTFGGGTNEIQRDLIARLGLGLPRYR